MTELINEIKKAMPGLMIRENEPMSAHCSFKIGGPVSAMAAPSSLKELEELCGLLKRAGVSPLVIGNGTNLLVTEKPLDRFVIKTGEGLNAVAAEAGNTVRAESGISLARLANYCSDLGLTGLEFAHGIPGTLGGAVTINAGAYGGEMKDVLISVRYLDENAQLREKAAAALDLSYRHSVFSGTRDVILSARLLLSPGRKEDIRARMSELASKRRASQPLDRPSAGSTFKRPKEGFAAALIDEAGLKGYSVGGAQVSQKHAGFVINSGGASFDDVLTLMEHIQKTVYARSGIELEPEVRIIRG